MQTCSAQAPPGSSSGSCRQQGWSLGGLLTRRLAPASCHLHFPASHEERRDRDHQQEKRLSAWSDSGGPGAGMWRGPSEGVRGWCPTRGYLRQTPRWSSAGSG